MFRFLIAFGLCVSGVSACMWDRDTLAEEAKGRPETVSIIVGWFNQYPPRYYEMRLERVARKIETSPGDLDLYDDAAVACDRLGRHDEAIAWMVRKKVILDALPASEAAEHRYRYLANLGTFIVHRWVSQPEGIRNADLAPLREGEKLIAKAIEENPEAHFGREVYQLQAIRWMLYDGAPLDESTTEFSEEGWVSIRGLYNSKSQVHEHVAGVTGLIQLGAAWRSVDAFHTLTAVLEAGGDASLSELSYLRELDLVEEGARSIHPVSTVRDRIIPREAANLKDRAPVSTYYPVARQAAFDRNQAWVAYQTERFAKGMHPDTHPDFWKFWVEPSFPEFPEPTISLRDSLENHPLAVFLGLVACLVIVVVAIYMFLRRLIRDYRKY